MSTKFGVDSSSKFSF